MISPEGANRIQPAADLALRPALPAQQITDKLVGMVAGQRLLAEIQAMLPNGTYRALINQRSVTLALPFAARSGDAIELEVAESDGKLTLAVVARGTAEAGKASGEAAATTLSRTGQLISNLLGGGRDGKSKPTALALNGNQPLAAGAPNNAQDLVPLLRQAIVQSGMFYEAHQAEWVEGRYTKAQLLQEPQGKLAPGTTAGQQASAGGASGNVVRAAADGAPALGATGEAANRTATITPAPAAQSAPRAQLAQPIAQQLQGLVQQQLEAFASQNFSWHGQAWPGQQIHWEIDNEPNGRAHDDDHGGTGTWQTRLRLTLPRLGEVDARVHIQGQQMKLSMIASDAATRDLLRSQTEMLRGQLEQAGLALAALGVAAPDETDEHAPSSG
ncbi:flagellar hook-length control protein FliK [Accumulibacter sp.]|uniref:flagellar hook-length control protein FliK n=1 Tax=Accumulibacter sp. TaxID=2053492 RepID=UPI00262F7A75|nr:flagellar hook-length control protein FliK [Accumulibacter sp.]